MSPDGATTIGGANLLVIAVLAALAGVALWWTRRRGAGAGDGPIRLVSVRSLGGKRLLALVEVEQERFLLGLTDENIACLGRIAPRREPGRLRSVASEGEVA